VNRYKNHPIAQNPTGSVRPIRTRRTAKPSAAPIAGGVFVVPPSKSVAPNKTPTTTSEGAGASDPGVRLDQFLEGLEPYSSIEVYVSPADRSGWPLNLSQFLRSVESALLSVASGTNRRKTVSQWRNAEGRILLERTVVVQSYVPLANTDRLLDEVLPDLRRIAGEHNQENLLVVIQGRPIFLVPTPVWQLEPNGQGAHHG